MCLTSVMTGSSCLPAWKLLCTPESIRTEHFSLEGVFVGLIQALRLRYTNVFDQGNEGRFMVEERATSWQTNVHVNRNIARSACITACTRAGFWHTFHDSIRFSFTSLRFDYQFDSIQYRLFRYIYQVHVYLFILPICKDLYPVSI